MKMNAYIFTVALSLSWVDASDCNVTIALWKNFGRVSIEDPTNTVGCCQMQGVSCVGQSVIKINWTDQSLVGTILPEIGTLKELTSLTLSLNSISGSIPLEIGNLTKLDYLDLGGNQLSGGIPSSIGQLGRLTALSLMNNQLSGSIPRTIAHCRELKTLWLGKNRFNGNIPPDIELLDKLETLMFQDNQFAVTISSCLVIGMTRLTLLDMSNNPNLTGAVWSSSQGLVVRAANTNITDCNSGNAPQSTYCSSMKCIRPEYGNTPSWWIVLLLLIIWIGILGIIGTYAYAEYRNRLLNVEEKSECKEDFESETDDESVVTKLYGLKQNGSNTSTETYNSTYFSPPNANTIASKSTVSSFFRSKYGDYGDKNQKPHKVVQPHTPANDDEIELKIGDTVIILEKFDDGWAFGLNESKDETGVFPLFCLQ